MIEFATIYLDCEGSPSLRASKLHTIDSALLLSTLAAFTLGVVMIYSATKASHVGGISLGDPPVRQAIYGVVGLLLMFIISRLDYRFMESFTVLFYIASVGLLGLVLLLGVITFGSQRWINLGIFPIQPSELVKLSVVVLLAKLYADHQRELDKPKWFMLAAVLAIVPATMVFLQPDLGTAIMVVAVFLGITLGAGVRARILVTTGLLSIPLVFIFWNWVMHDYQRDRLLIFLDPQKDLLGQGYNIIQARTAIGGGGWLGQGYLSGTQTQLEFTKVQYSDFIFSVVAEEFGFIGAVALIALLFLLVWRCLVVASRAQDAFRQPHSGGCCDLDWRPDIHQRRHEYRPHARHGHSAPLHQLRRLFPHEHVAGAWVGAERLATVKHGHVRGQPLAAWLGASGPYHATTPVKLCS